MPVPPVVLYRRSDAAPGDETSCCLSLFCHPSRLSWGVLRGTKRDRLGAALADALREPIERHLPIAATRALVLDTWILQNDHDHPDNCVFGYDLSDLPNRGFVFFDYGLAFAFAAPVPEIGRYFDEIGVVRFPHSMIAVIDRGVLRETVSRIENYPESVIREIVKRIPDDFLHPDEKSQIAEGLIRRKRKLSALFGI